MLDSYTVCGYCFKDLEPSHRCECLTGQNKDQILAIRYCDQPDTKTNECHPNIVGQYDDWAQTEADDASEMFIGAKILLAPEVHLRGRHKELFEQACQHISEIIESSMQLNLTSIASDSSEEELALSGNDNKDEE